MNVSGLLEMLQVRVQEGDGDLPVFIGGLPNEGPKVTRAEVFFFEVD